VLVVDDEPEICELTRAMLSRAGYEAEGVTDPRLVVDKLRENQFHLVVLDMMMPELDGTKVLEQIRKVDSDLAVVVATAHPSVDNAVSSLRLAASDYVSKPFRQEDLLATVQRVLEAKGLTRDPEAELHRALGRAIRDARTRQDLTLKQLARRTGLSVSLLSQIERAESSASIGSLYKIATALKVPLSELFAGY
jgi:DNA-binding NtrC family response regulator